MSRSATPARSNGATLDPDALAELERERDFLLGSLDDLDAEHAAGDLDRLDYEALADDYTRRLAEVQRAIDEEREAFAALESRLSNRQRWITFAAVAVVALIAGLVLARASGFRSPQDSVTGDIRSSSETLLAEADTLTREGRWPEAVAVYDQVLEITPANVEALTYRGWLTARLGDAEAGLLDLGEAIEVDASFPDARVFSAILLTEAQRFDEAAENLGVLDTLDAPAEILGLVDGSDLRTSVAAGLIEQRFGDGTDIDLDQLNVSLEDVARAGDFFLQNGDAVLGFRVLKAVLEADPTNLFALVAQGRLATDQGLYEVAPDLAAQSLGLLDDALALQPDSAIVRLVRAQARYVQGDPTGAAQDLALVDPAELPEDLVELHTQLSAALG